MDPARISELVVDIARQARDASLELACLPTASKNRFLNALADAIEAESDAILEANQLDLEAARRDDLPAPMLERLTLNAERVRKIAAGTRQVAGLPDPVGQEIERLHPPAGFDLRKIRVPIGVIGIIYESRPNVTVDCAILCLKSGNASILRGGKEAYHSNMKFGMIIGATLNQCGINPHAVQVIPTTDRAALHELLKLDSYIHCIIPRGGEGLIRYTVEHSRIPVIKHYTGVCNIYIDADADPDKAEAITINAKCQRPSVCNAVENLIVHEAAATSILPRVAKALIAGKVELRGDARTVAILAAHGLPCKDAVDQDFFTEYNDLILSIAVVANLRQGIQFINTHGSGHSDAIITEDKDAAATFLAGVDAATVYHNASTRFTDGFEFGLGAEIGISTDRLHARGPMGLNELCTYKYVIHGQGETRL